MKMSNISHTIHEMESVLDFWLFLRPSNKTWFISLSKNLHFLVISINSISQLIFN